MVECGLERHRGVYKDAVDRLKRSRKRREYEVMDGDMGPGEMGEKEKIEDAEQGGKRKKKKRNRPDG